MDAEIGKPLLPNSGPKRRAQKQPAGHDQTFTGQQHDSLVNHLVASSMLQPPPRCVECLHASKPFFEFLVVVIRMVMPGVIWFCKMAYYIYKKTPANELKIIYGLALCFFGGEFCASIAAIECFRRTGGDKLMMCVNDLWVNACLAHEASLEDDKAEGRQLTTLSPHDWYKHKLAVILKAVEPDVLAQACAGLYQGFLGLMVALKFKFAATVALACSIADLVRKPVAFLVTPMLAAVLPKDYHKWINQIINITMKAIATHLAWKLQEAISSVQSALMGASLVGTGVIIFFNKKFDPKTSWADEMIGMPLAITGIWFQFKHNYRLPFPYNIALLPLSIVETLLRFCITWFPVQDTVLPSRP